MADVASVGTAEWEAEVLQSAIPVLVDFWAEWCGPCKMVSPVVEQVAQKFAGRLKAVKVNVDDHPELAVQYGIRGIPTLFLVKGGQIVHKIVGFVPEPELTRQVETALAS